jgi:DNA primase
MRFSPELLEGIRQGYNLAEIVGQSVELRPIGGDNLGLCPFHDENTPSFRVNERRYRCFGCGKRGDIISWYCEHHGLTFPEAVKRLTKEDLPLPSSMPARSAPISSEYDAPAIWQTICDNEAAQDLFKKSKDAESKALSYVSRRNLPEEVGFCGDALDAAVDLNVLDRAGLVGSSMDGLPYFRLHNRITIPLRSPSGHILGFTGRAVPGLTSERAPKYLDPKASPAYQKRRYLYGLDVVRSDPWAKYLAVVEGPLDAIAFSKYMTCVATMGCHMSEGQARIIEHYSTATFIAYDGDMPGIEAAFKAAAYRPRDTLIAIFPDGMDPEQWLNKYGYEADLAQFRPTEIMSSAMTQRYDTSLLQALSKPYVEDNIKAGFPHYNVIDYVMQAQPEFAQEIRDAVIAMRDGCVEKDGKMVPQEAQVKAVLRGWFKAVRALRVKRGKEE